MTGRRLSNLHWETPFSLTGSQTIFKNHNKHVYIHSSPAAQTIRLGCQLAPAAVQKPERLYSRTGKEKKMLCFLSIQMHCFHCFRLKATFKEALSSFRLSRLVVRTLRCGRSNDGSTPSSDIDKISFLIFDFLPVYSGPLTPARGVWSIFVFFWIKFFDF